MRRVMVLPLALALVRLASAPSSADASPVVEYDASLAARPGAEVAALARAAAEAGPMRARVRVASTDERFGLPAFVWARRVPPVAPPGATRAAGARTPDQAARAHLATLGPLYRLGRDDLDGVRLQHLHDTGRGALIASYRQEIDGVEVFRDEFRVCLDRGLGLVSVSGSLPARGEAPADARAAFARSVSQAAAAALQDFTGLATAPADLVPRGDREGGYEAFAPPAPAGAAGAGRAVRAELRARKVWFRLAGTLEPAYYVEIMGESDAAAYVFSARDGRLLLRHGLQQDAAFSYRVWAHADAPHFPMDGPQGDAASPHPAGLPNLYQPALTAPALVTLQNGPIPTEDPWLPPGATESAGNNVDAYADLAEPDGFAAGDLRASVTSPGVFDRAYDPEQNPGVSWDQRMAAITTLFYVNNFLHDWFYDAGFDEAAGNAQADNYGRGGLAGDRLLAEGQDFSGTSNANMATPADGAPPRMQMYVFNAPSGANLVVSAPAAIAGAYLAGTASFGPQSYSVTGTVVAGQDAIAPVDDACSAITSDVAGRIALVDRGTCSYATKVFNAQSAGAIGVILVNSVPGSVPPAMGGTAILSIPVVSVTQDVGAALRAQLGAGVTVTLQRPLQVQRDGTIDGHIIAHEWGHYISNRLIGNASGLGNLQGGALGEGWGDFHALLMTVRPGDDPAGAYAIGPYALSGNLVATDVYYFGVRRYPYSTDPARNPLTFRHIEDGRGMPIGPPINGDPTGVQNSEVHNAGEVWCSMLWECWAALVTDSGRLTFDEARRRMRDYLVAGYQLTPSLPTFVEARDAILSAALAGDPADFALLAQAFARRGLGTGAVAPDRAAAGNAGVVESFAVGGDLAVTSVTLTDAPYTCDGDGYLDRGERGTLAIQVTNTGWTPLSSTTVTVSSADPAVTFPAGAVFPLPASGVFQPVSVEVPVELSGTAAGTVAAFTVNAGDPGLLSPGPRSSTLHEVVQVDEVPSLREGFEAHGFPWTVADGRPVSAGAPWTREAVSPSAHEMHVEDPASLADWRLTSPPIAVSPVVPLTIAFRQRYAFEFDPQVRWDGGVLELSADDADWTDVGASASPGYDGMLASISGNPLGGRPAWTGNSAGYPAMQVVTVPLGTAYAGRTVRFRFRFASDVAVGAPGWWIDDVTVSGAVAPPFVELAPESGVCLPLAVEEPRPERLALVLASGHPTGGPVRLRFALPEAGAVRLTIHDLAGRRVATLAEGVFPAGWHEAPFARRPDSPAPGAGVYFARLSVDGVALTRRIVLLR